MCVVPWFSATVVTPCVQGYHFSGISGNLEMS